MGMEILAKHPYLSFASELVKNCCSLAGQIQSEMAVTALEKSDRSPVTVADFSIQALVAKQLRKETPGIPLVGEESTSAIPEADRERVLETIAGFVERFEPNATAESVAEWINLGRDEASGSYWVLDPVDGTRGFLRNAHYAVALALIVDGVVELGVIGCPRLWIERRSSRFDQDWRPADKGCLMVAVRDQGCWLSPLAVTEFHRVYASATESAAEAVVLRSFESSHTDVAHFEAALAHMGAGNRSVLMDSMAKYVLMAAGYCDVLMRLVPPGSTYKEKVWDHAAGWLAVKEAGGEVTDSEGKALDFTTGRVLANNTGLLVTNGKLHRAALAGLRATQP